MLDPNQPIPSAYLKGVSRETGEALRAMRTAIEKAGPLDYTEREYIMLTSFAQARFEEAFRIHAGRALRHGMTKQTLEQAVLILLGATVPLLPVVDALRWIDEEHAKFQAAGAGFGSVHSRDGTAIGFTRSGDGPPLVLVHGASSEKSRWTPVVRALQRRFTVYAMDRRGRGTSGDAPAYAIEREVEDVAAVVDAAGAPAAVVAHSYGALCALEATRLACNIGKLVLYEPPIVLEALPADGPEAKVIAEIDQHLQAGDRAGALEIFFRGNLGLSDAEIAEMRERPSWPSRVALAHTLARELRERRRYRFDEGRFKDYAIPTLLVLGGESPARHAKVAARLQSALAGSRLAVLAGHGHIAIDAGPDLFAATVIDFLRK